MNDTQTETQPQLGTGGGLVKPVHIVALVAGKPADQALCGYLWDRIHVQHNGEICQECVDELRRRGRG